MAQQAFQPHGGLLKDLIGYWQDQYPQRAAGGWWALAGFAFQFSTYLLRFFQHLEKGAGEPGQLAEMEKLSDIVCPSDGKFTLIQVKRTLNRSNLKVAVEDAYLVTDLCLKKIPELLPHLRFQIVCRQRGTETHIRDLSISEVLDSNADVTSWQVMLDKFDVENPIIEEANTLNHLHTFLWNIGVLDTSAFIQQCLGRMLEYFNQHDKESHRSLGRDLANLFYSAQRRANWTPLGHILSSDDVKASEQFKDINIITGPVPKLEHLRKGYFRHRQHIFSSTWAAFVRWLSNLEHLEQTPTDKIPVFWISGRSGEGKSVLLLQLIAHFLQSTLSEPLLYLKSKNDLAKLLENIPEHSLHSSEYSRKFFVVVDDLYSIGDREKWDENIRNACLFRTPPVAVITCGPTEQLEQFSSRLRDQMQVVSIKVPKLQVNECYEFVDWYEARTGQKRSLKDVTLDNPILVHFMFELSRGMRMTEFAKRFKQRLEHLGLLESVHPILALNALYMDAPADLIKDNKSRDALERLSEEDQLHFTTASTDTWREGFGIRLLHPHLAWLLFMEWVEPPATLAKTWARQLAKVFEAIENKERILDDDKDRTKRPSGEAILLYQVLHSDRLSYRTDETLTSTVDRQELICELYRLHVLSHSGRPTVATLNKWLEMVCKKPSLNLSPDPVECALNELKNDASASLLSGSVAGWLWFISETRPGPEAQILQIAAEDFFNRFPNNIYVGYTLARILVRSKNLQAARSLVFSWLEQHPDHPQAIYVLCRLLSEKHQDALQEPTAQALSWLEKNAGYWMAHELIEALLAANNENQEVADKVLSWFNSHSRLWQSYSALASLIATNSTNAEVVEFVFEWIKMRLGDRRIYQPLAPLVAAKGQDPKVRELALLWLDQNINNSHAHQVLAPLVAISGQDADVYHLAMQWVKQNDGHSNLGAVLSPLIRRYPKDIEVNKYTITWFKKNYRSSYVGIVLAPLIMNNPDGHTLIENIIIWLDNNPKSIFVPSIIASLSTLDVSKFEDSLANWVKEKIKHFELSHPVETLILQKLNLMPDSETIDKALSIIDTVNFKQRGLLLKTMSHTLVNHPQCAIEYLTRSYDERRKNSICPLIVNDLKWNPERVAPFMSGVLMHIPPKFVYKILKNSIIKEIQSDSFDEALAKWIIDNYDKIGYKQIMNELYRRPDQLRRLERFGVIIDMIEIQEATTIITNNEP